MYGTCYSNHILINRELFRDRFSKNTQISNFMEICAVLAKLLHADGRTDRQKTDRQHEANSYISQFVKAPLKGQLILQIIAVQTHFIAEVKRGHENLRYSA
jgi:hypothetical protein